MSPSHLEDSLAQQNVWPGIVGRQTGCFGKGETKGNETGSVPLTTNLSTSELVLCGTGMYFISEAVGRACLVLCPMKLC